MEIINVIVVGLTDLATYGVISVTSYVVNDVQLTGEVANEAEEKFKSILEGLGITDEDELEKYIEDGVYETGGQSVSIVWSYPENLQS